MDFLYTFFGQTDYWAKAVLLFVMLIGTGICVCIFTILIVPYAQAFARSLKADARRPRITVADRCIRLIECLRAARIGISLLFQYVFE